MGLVGYHNKGSDMLGSEINTGSVLISDYQKCNHGVHVYITKPSHLW